MLNRNFWGPIGEYNTEISCMFPFSKILDSMGVECTPYVGLYREALPKGVPFSGWRYMKG